MLALVGPPVFVGRGGMLVGDELVGDGVGSGFGELVGSGVLVGTDVAGAVGVGAAVWTLSSPMPTRLGKSTLS